MEGRWRPSARAAGGRGASLHGARRRRARAAVARRARVPAASSSTAAHGRPAAALGVHVTSTSAASGRSPSSARSSVPRGHDDRLPWHELASMDAVFFVAGDVDALVHARRARVLTATTRELDVLRSGGVQLDALIGSGEDEAERYLLGELDPPPRLVVATAGSLGGWAQPGGPFTAAAPPGDSTTRTARRQLRRGPDVRARRRARRIRGDRARGPLRRCRPDGAGCVAASRAAPLTVLGRLNRRSPGRAGRRSAFRRHA